MISLLSVSGISIMFVKKADRSVRVCVNDHELNKGIIQYDHPISLLSIILTRLYWNSTIFDTIFVVLIIL
jgi:hypothetical protein